MDDKKTMDELRPSQRIRMKLRRLPSAIKKLLREYRRDARIHAKEGALGLSLGLCAYLLGSATLLFGTSPLGMAFICASPKKIIWIFLGLCVSALSLPENPYIYLFAYATALAVRLLSRLLIDIPEGSEKKTRSPFTESVYLRMATSAACAFIVGIYLIIAGEFEYFHLFGAIFSIIVAPLATFVYAGCFEEKGKWRELAIGALLVSLTFALRGIYLIGISAGAFFAFFVTLYVCRQTGLWKGALVGIVCGLAYAPHYAPMFAIAGITVGVLWDISAFGALVAGGTGAMLWGFYIEGVGAMSRLLPAIMLASVCYMGTRKLSLFPAAKDLLFSGKYCSDMNDAAMAIEATDAAYKRMGELSDAFSSLSEIFYNLSDRLSRPGLPDLRKMCDRIYDKYCPVCPNKGLCWELEYASSKKMLSDISEKLSGIGFADESDIPEYMRSRCVALPGIVGEINHQFSNLCRDMRSSDKTEVFAMDYASVSGLLAEVSKDRKNDYAPDRELSEKLTGVLSAFGFGDGGVSVYGERQKRIIARGFDISKGGVVASELKKSIEKACAFPVSDPIIELKDNIMTLKLTSARRFSAVSTMLTSSARGEENSGKCGDSVSVFESADDRYYALISDGMGSGEEAALTSSISATFLQKMLSVGNDSCAAIKMLGSFIKAKRGECSATVDLLELDMMTGRAHLIKCGAAATFVKRGRELTKLSAATLPLGILDATDIKRLSFDAEDGDIVIMLSDGVALGDDDCTWLSGLLSSEWDSDIPAMARRIISLARKNGSGDDISVVITKIKK